MGSPAELADVLTVAWLRRKRYEAQLQAVAIVNLLGQALSSDGERPAERRSTDRSTGNDAVMRELGVTF